MTNSETGREWHINPLQKAPLRKEENSCPTVKRVEERTLAQQWYTQGVTVFHTLRYTQGGTASHTLRYTQGGTGSYTRWYTQGVTVSHTRWYTQVYNSPHSGIPRCITLTPGGIPRVCNSHPRRYTQGVYLSLPTVVCPGCTSLYLRWYTQGGKPLIYPGGIPRVVNL